MIPTNTGYYQTFKVLAIWEASSFNCTESRMNLCICTYICSFYHFSLKLLIYTPRPFLIDLYSFSIIWYPCIFFAPFQLPIYVLLRKSVLCLHKTYKYFPICSFSPQNYFKWYAFLALCFMSWFGSPNFS